MLLVGAGMLITGWSLLVEAQRRSILPLVHKIEVTFKWLAQSAIFRVERVDSDRLAVTSSEMSERRRVHCSMMRSRGGEMRGNTKSRIVLLLARERQLRRYCSQKPAAFSAKATPTSHLLSLQSITRRLERRHRRDNTQKTGAYRYHRRQRLFWSSQNPYS